MILCIHRSQSGKIIFSYLPSALFLLFTSLFIKRDVTQQQNVLLNIITITSFFVSILYLIINPANTNIHNIKKVAGIITSLSCTIALIMPETLNAIPIPIIAISFGQNTR